MSPVLPKDSASLPHSPANLALFLLTLMPKRQAWVVSVIVGVAVSAVVMVTVGGSPVLLVLAESLRI